MYTIEDTSHFQDVTNINRPSTSQTTETTATTQQISANWSPPPLYVPGKQGTLFNAAAESARQQSEQENIESPSSSEPPVANVSVSISMSRQESIDCKYKITDQSNS